MTRDEVTSELTSKDLKKLRCEFTLVAQEVWVDDDHRVDFVGFKPLVSTPYPASLERGTFVFVEVKSCMADYKSGHGLTFDGDRNWLVCPKELCETLRESLMLPYGTAVLCPNKAGALVERIHSVEYGSRRGKGALELLWRMVNRSSRVWRTSRTVIESEVQPR